jgi:hypothetical protein
MYKKKRKLYQYIKWVIIGLKHQNEHFLAISRQWNKKISKHQLYILLYTYQQAYKETHYITITSIFKCNRLRYNYFVNVIDYITDYIWCYDNQCIFKFAVLLLFVSLYACWYVYSNIYNWCFDIFLFHCLDIAKKCSFWCFKPIITHFILKIDVIVI